MDERRPCYHRGARQRQDGERVRAQCERRIVLRAVDIVIGGAVHDQFRSGLAQDGTHRAFVGDVQA